MLTCKGKHIQWGGNLRSYSNTAMVSDIQLTIGTILTVVHDAILYSQRIDLSGYTQWERALEVTLTLVRFSHLQSTTVVYAVIVCPGYIDP